MGESRFLMCPPTHYDVDYVINPWMEGNVHRSAKAVAAAQWQQLQGVLARHARVEQLQPQPGLPDLVFTANAGVVVDDRVVLARFFHPERQGEEPWFQSWFESQGYRVTLLTNNRRVTVLCDAPQKEFAALKPTFLAVCRSVYR